MLLSEITVGCEFRMPARLLRAVPAMTRNAASSEVAFKSFCFIFTMSRTCLRVTLPTLFRFGSPEPFSTFAAFSSNVAAGGVLVINVNDLSLKTVMITGIIRPCWSLVLALNCLQNSMMFTPF